MEPDPVILDGARRHGIADHDMLHAYRNPIRVFERDELIMLIGPDQSGRLIEVGVVSAEGLDLIVHAMSARSRFVG